MFRSTSDDQARQIVRSGIAIPAHPLALTSDRALDQRHMRALTRYYLDAGVGGLAVGVHTTQFAIRQHGLYEPVLRFVADSAAAWIASGPQEDRPVVLVAGVTGELPEALAEAETARDLGYHAALVNVAALRDRTEPEILDHCRAIGEVMPMIGFALLPECGGFHLSYGFWRAFAELESVLAIKMAPFNRYRTLDIVRGVVDAHAEDRVTLYTGNDDHIVADLLTPFVLRRDGAEVTIRIKGGLLGQWSVGTRAAVELLERAHAIAAGAAVPASLLGLDAAVTDCNAAIYDARNDFAGCLSGVLDVLTRQGLVQGTWCLDPAERLSEGQHREISRVLATYPDLLDTAFVAENRERWLAQPADQAEPAGLVEGSVR